MNSNKSYIVVKAVDKEPNMWFWSYPVEEIAYILEQINDGDRENGCEFYLFNGRLYEAEETEIG